MAKLPLVEYRVADKGYDSEPLRMQIREKGSVPVILRKQNSTVGNEDIDGCLYKYRHLVENVFARLKHFRAVATRYDKLKRNFESVIALACVFLWLPM
jgi:transposase